ncbi:glycosyltransferase [Curtobacterium sp. DN_7.5]|uniref:glycosyltransferase family 2 protein n=1 Tax=Curtobacterium sp. DN_7.5 TaxID=3049047 RepID=UPI001F5918DD|nr:glycosyltransferase [Curtobacterium sp. DN_7.5]
MSAAATGPTSVGIVVAVGPSNAYLDQQLTALSEQQHDGAVELVLSCNGTPVEPVRARCDRVNWPPDWHLHVIDSSAELGAGPARNAGSAAIETDLLVFCDADDVVADGWLAAMVDALREHDVVGGRLQYDRINGEDVWEIRSSTGLGRRFGHLPYAPTCNLGLSRAAFDATGGFDPRAVKGQDTDLCWRAAYAGFPIAYAPDAVVHYRLRPTIHQAFRNARAYGRYDPLLLRMHRPHGARNSLRSSCRELASTAWAILRAPLGRRRLRTAAIRVGAVLGRLEGSLRFRTFTL